MSFNFITNDGIKLAVVGLLPGYNSKIDTNSKDLEKDLLHNISFIDLQLASYSIGDNDGQSKSIIDVYKNLLSTAIDGKRVYSYKAYNNDTKDHISETFNELTKKYLRLSDINGVRIIASSDSMATETISNNFGESMVQQIATNSKLSQMSKKFNSYANIMKELSYNRAFELLNKDAKGFLSILKSSALGIQLAFPRFFESSNYSHTMSLFFKLTSPSGHKEDIQTLVLNPLKLLMILASPNSMYGITYAYPFIYKVVAYGNSFMSLGYISDITISKGSMETMYSDDFLPLSIDVRMNIRTLSENFANIIKKNENDDFNMLGLQTPATSNPDAIQNSQSGVISTPKIITLNL